MTPERLHQVRSLVESALDRPPADRDRYLAEACGEDRELLESAHEIIGLDEGVESFMELPEHPSIDRILLDVVSGEPIGMRIGPYRIMQVLAAGGMGTVYLALRDDDEYEQQVAIKLINRGMNTRHLKERFHRERRLLARLEHPHIARLLDGGTTFDDRPYMVMEYVEGVPIDQFCDQRRATIEERLQLMLTVCEAVHYAHQNLIIHRDLKPGNILVTADGVSKLVDFGISRMLDESGSSSDLDLTRTGLRVMTPQYASPEQIKGNRITTASDIYSLGVILYELLTGHRPYQLESLSRYEKEKIICETEPTRPSQMVGRSRPGRASRDEPELVGPEDIARTRSLREDQLKRQLQGDLDNIVLKALVKEPSGRYSTVLELAADIQRHLDGQPVLARAGTMTYRTGKFIRRNKTMVTAGTVVLLALLVGATMALFGLREARLERNAALSAKLEADGVTRYLQDTILGASPYSTGRDVSMEQLLRDATVRMESELAGRPAVQAGVSYAIAQSYAGMWQWELAGVHARKSMEIYRKQYGNVHPSVANAASLYGQALTFQRKPRSIEVLREALAIRRKLYDETHELIGESYGDLAYAMWRGVDPPRSSEAEAYFTEAIRRYRALQLDSSPELAKFTFGYARMLQQLGRGSEADVQYRKAIEIYRSRPGDTDRFMIECMWSYANFLQDSEQSERARQLYYEVLDRLPSSFANRVLADTCWNLGVVEQILERHDEAEHFFQRALRTELDLTENEQGEPIEPDSAIASFMIGESEYLYDDILRTLAAHRPGDFELVQHFGWLGDFLRRDRRIDEAESIFAECAKVVLEQFGEDHLLVVELRGLTGMCLVDRQEYEAAEPMVLESYQWLREHLGERDRNTQAALRRVIAMYEVWNKPEKLKLIMEQASQS